MCNFFVNSEGEEYDDWIAYCAGAYEASECEAHDIIEVDDEDDESQPEKIEIENLKKS